MIARIACGGGGGLGLFGPVSEPVANEDDAPGGRARVLQEVDGLPDGDIRSVVHHRHEVGADLRQHLLDDAGILGEGRGNEGRIGKDDERHLPAAHPVQDVLHLVTGSGETGGVLVRGVHGLGEAQHHDGWVDPVESGVGSFCQAGPAMARMASA